MFDSRKQSYDSRQTVRGNQAASKVQNATRDIAAAFPNNSLLFRLKIMNTVLAARDPYRRCRVVSRC